MNIQSEALQAHRERLWRQWVNDPGTKRFFDALELDRIDMLTKSAENAIRTGEDNAKEHNQLIVARTHKKIAEKYGSPDHYPYSAIDDRDEASLRPVGLSPE